MKKILLWDPRFPERSPLPIVVSNAVAAATVADGTGALLAEVVQGIARIGGDVGVLPDLPTIALVVAPAAQAEGSTGTTAYAWTATLVRNGSTATIPYVWSVAGNGANPADAVDFGGAFPGGSGTFAPGETIKTGTILVTGDQTVELDESFLMTFVATGVGTATATGTILNDDVAPTTRMQNISSAMRGPGLDTSSASNGTDTTFNSETWHYNDSGASITGGQLVLAHGWKTDSDANGAETVLPGSITYTGAIEYPVGTYTPVTWGGSASSGQTGPANFVSDGVPVTIPNAALYGIHVFGTGAAGMKWALASMVKPSLFQAGGKADRYESGVGLTDKTLGTPGGNTDLGYRPIGFRAAVPVASAKRVHFVIGDSTGAGASDGSYDGRNNRSAMGRAAGKRQLAFAHFAVTGTTAQASAVSGKLSMRLDAMVKLNPTDVGVMFGNNDLQAGRTLAQLQADMLNICNQIAAALPGVQIWTNTITPRHASMGADNGETVGRQIIPTSGAFVPGSGSLRAQYNTWVRTLPAPLSYFIDLADAFDVNASNVPTRDGGYWATGEGGGRTYLDPAYAGQVTGSPTTTSVPTNIAKASTANYFAGYAQAFAIFADAVPRRINVNSGGTLTFGGGNGSTALSAAPAAGDAISLQTARMRSSGDGVHFGVEDNLNEFGGAFIARDLAAVKFAPAA